MAAGMAVSRRARASGVSLWLMPEGEAYDRLRATIESLAVRLGTPRFAPHVTLLPGIVAPEPEVREAAAALASELAAFSIRLDGVDGTDAPFRCLFVRAEPSPILRDAHARASRRFGREPDPSYDPHLSLVYGTLAPRRKATLARQLARRVGGAIEVRRLHVWRTDGPVDAWRALVSFPLPHPS